MHRITFGRRFFSLTLVALAVCATWGARPAHADTPDQWDGNWHGSITPYGWLPGVTAKSRFQVPNGPSVETKSDNNILDHLSGAFMLAGDIRKGDWGMFADLDWVKFTNENGRFTNIGGDRIGASANLNTRWGFKGGMVNLAGLYTLAHGQQGFVDLLFGGRYLWLKGNLNWNFNLNGNAGNVNLANSGHLNNQTHVTDAIVGLRGRWSPFDDKNWFFPYYVDVGSGDSDSTYQLVAGVAYGFSWGDIALVYRDVQYKESASDKSLEKLELGGPAFSLTWHF
ncbi:MAG TPA: hypothetical protein VFG49_01725 [Dyella sp.]|uniref:hypothetical protein n=1 Tax=Dyella sp. TaxID=1869338 RepID=UPI002D788847|nr:hypothetical protein [Dyella sp.]HET6552231.1 hypothetical protein [Dyella sp.]